ncbi:hypothetical protein ROHU_029319 [Labeo rohita]|uniref:Uncharacterized protein n=1 Tax=Labeo rohita TaxID=84645 RepID=A0A498M071_LABRO|nr:hypothetical protein ROHU_029319 [Labeo rohita]
MGQSDQDTGSTGFISKTSINIDFSASVTVAVDVLGCISVLFGAAQEQADDYDQDLMEVREHGGTRYDGASRDTSSLAHISAAREKSSEKGLVRDTLAICCAKWPCPLLPLCTRENNIMILGSSADARMLSEKSQFMEYTLALNLRT